MPDRAAYLAIMRVFTSTLLADLSAHDLAERLGERFTVETFDEAMRALPLLRYRVTPETRAWLAQPALARLWDLLRDRLERNGLQIRGRLRLDDVTEAEREALSLLTGRSYVGGRVSIALADLDAALRAGAAWSR